MKCGHSVNTGENRKKPPHLNYNYLVKIILPIFFHFLKITYYLAKIIKTNFGVIKHTQSKCIFNNSSLYENMFFFFNSVVVVFLSHKC